VVVHEMGIALEVYRVCREAVQAQGGGRIDSVRVALGELAAIEPDLLAFAWQAVTADGPDSGSQLDISWRRAIQRCPRCGETKDRSEGSWLPLCPDCAGPLEITGGLELDVIEVVFETDDELPGDRSPADEGTQEVT
jgi:hydrogenase nickel incorporation protein HypA/HybF